MLSFTVVIFLQAARKVLIKKKHPFNCRFETKEVCFYDARLSKYKQTHERLQ